MPIAGQKGAPNPVKPSSRRSSSRSTAHKPESVLVEACLVLVNESVTLSARQGSNAITHDLWIGADLGELVAVLIRPSTEQQAPGA